MTEKKVKNVFAIECGVTKGGNAVCKVIDHNMQTLLEKNTDRVIISKPSEIEFYKGWFMTSFNNKPATCTYNKKNKSLECE